jgi:hypothetical protein
MNLTQAQAFFGLRASATPTGTNVTNDVQIGVGNTVLPLTGANVAYSLRAFFTTTSSELAFDPSAGLTTGSTAFVAGVQQVETATAAGTITGAGDAAVVVTATGMTGSPLTLNVPVALNDTAAQWAAKVRTALAANVTIAGRFDVSGTSTAVILTRKPRTTIISGATSVPIRFANDANLNISLDNGTCTGITPAATSANTTAGVATEGVFIVDGDGKDFEGVDLPDNMTIRGILMHAEDGDFEVTGSSVARYDLAEGEITLEVSTKQFGAPALDPTLTFSLDETEGILSITVIGQTF